MPFIMYFTYEELVGHHHIEIVLYDMMASLAHQLPSISAAKYSREWMTIATNDIQSATEPIWFPLQLISLCQCLHINCRMYCCSEKQLHSVHTVITFSN